MNEDDPLAVERAFYDDTDYSELQLEPANDVQVVHRLEPRSTFALRLDGETIAELRECAQRTGRRPTQLAREWLIERLQSEQPDQHVRDERATIRRLEQRLTDLERRLSGYVGGSDSFSEPIP